LTFRGYEVFLASDGEEGLVVARSMKPELILCDVMMPLKNGFQVCKTLRSEGINVPFIFLTAKGLSEDQSEGFQSGADDYIVKPFDPVILEAKILALLKRTHPA
jgi:DNA-binding response OmpR family regulator